MCEPTQVGACHGRDYEGHRRQAEDSLLHWCSRDVSQHWGTLAQRVD
jgi:hypothetical protein